MKRNVKIPSLMVIKRKRRRNSVFNNVALFQLGPSLGPDGYEVCGIYFMRSHKAFEVEFEESEVLLKK